MTWFRKTMLGVMCAVLAACAANPIRQAETVEQRAYAAYGTFVILEETAVRLTAPGSALPVETQRAIVTAAETAQPVVDTLSATLREYEVAKADFAAAKTEAPVFQVVVDKLGDWVTRAEVALSSLRAAVRGRP